MKEKTPEAIWDKKNDASENWIQFVDQNVLLSTSVPDHLSSGSDNIGLPQGTRIHAISPHGSSCWTQTAKIQTEQADGSPLSFFLKVLVLYVSRIISELIHRNIGCAK